jgi:hypothetical protein
MSERFRVVSVLVLAIVALLIALDSGINHPVVFFGSEIVLATCVLWLCLSGP